VRWFRNLMNFFEEYRLKENYWEAMAREAAKVTLPDGRRVTFEEYQDWTWEQPCKWCGRTKDQPTSLGFWVTETDCGCRMNIA
jgi:hypothetical protein